MTVRRYRAERMLRKEFEGLRGRVIGTVRGRLRASGVSLDASDLEACYAQAWQGLYAAMLAGEEIANPTGWLALVTFRRAIEEHRSRRRSYPSEGVGAPDGPRGAYRGGESEPAQEQDFAGELDDRIRLRQVFEGLRGRLGERELQAAALCYLQGLSRVEAAARMGISEQRMRKLMEGPGPGRPGVAGKVGELLETIRGGGWCEEQGSLMRGLAFGILDPEGERYRLAMAHRRECPACRAYVLSLRGLAAVLPVPFLPGVLGAGALAGLAGAGAGAASARGRARRGWGRRRRGDRCGVGCCWGWSGCGRRGAGGLWHRRPVSLGRRRGRGGRRERWLAAGGRRGCEARRRLPGRARGRGELCRARPQPRPRPRRAGAGSPAPFRGTPRAWHGANRDDGCAEARLSAHGRRVGGLRAGDASSGRSGAASAASVQALTPAARASREFGPERAFAGTTSSTTSSSSGQGAPSAKAASVGGGGASEAASSTAASSASKEFTSGSGGQAAAQQSSAGASASSSGGDAAQHEFGIG